jgi:hypothetical protein
MRNSQTITACLRKCFYIQACLIKYIFRRFIEPPLTNRYANRFGLMYELHRARHLRAIDQRDRVFAMLGHYSVRIDNAELAALQADYTKTTAQVYVDVAVRALTGDSSLITPHCYLVSGSPTRHGSAKSGI